MTTIAIQNLFSYVEEENLAALKAHLEKFKEVDGRSDVSKQMSKSKMSHRNAGVFNSNNF